MPKPTIAFIGAGKMATALAKGFVNGQVVDAAAIVASDASPEALATFAGELAGCQLATCNSQAAQGADVVILAVKPQYMFDVLAELKPTIDATTLVISIAAGVTLDQIQQRLASGARVVRVMPNTPSIVGCGACGFCLGEHATQDDAALTAKLMGAVGVAYQLTDAQLHAVTGLSGSGPAFVYTVIEAMGDAGVRAGLPRAVAADLAARTVAGAAQMVLETGQHTALLREAVTSPGGTTAAGLAELERLGLRNALAGAIGAAVEKSKEMGENKPSGA